MNDPDRIRQRQHWQAIAEQLGLAPEPEEPSASEPNPLPAATRSEVERTAEPAPPALEPVTHSEKEAPLRRGRRGRSARTEKEPEARAPADESPVEQPASTDSGGEAAAPSEERPGLKRERRRRSARASAGSARENADTPSGAEAPSQGEASAEAAEPAKGRGRGRSRPKKAAPVAAEARTETQSQEKPALEEGEEAELDDVRSLSDWNVPSWNELIASLYRPER